GERRTMNKLRSKPMGDAIEVDEATTQRGAEIERELETLGEHYMNADRPGLLERAGRFDYHDVNSRRRARTARRRGARSRSRRCGWSKHTRIFVRETSRSRPLTLRTR